MTRPTIRPANYFNRQFNAADNQAGLSAIAARRFAQADAQHHLFYDRSHTSLWRDPVLHAEHRTPRDWPEATLGAYTVGVATDRTICPAHKEPQ